MKGKQTHPEMIIHEMCTIQHLFKAVHSHRESDAHTDCTPQGITTPNPIPERKHIGCVNAELTNLKSLENITIT